MMTMPLPVYRSWNKFIRLYYVDEIVCNDTALTITITDGGPTVNVPTTGAGTFVDEAGLPVRGTGARQWAWPRNSRKRPSVSIHWPAGRKPAVWRLAPKASGSYL